MASIPEFQTALKLKAPGDIQLVHGSPIPVPKPDEVLVKVVCVALNPVDPKSLDLSPVPGATIGCDFSGDVVTVGAAVKKALVPGDRVCSSTFGNNPDDPNNGAFAEYVAIPGDLVLRIPPEMSYQSAATLGLGLATVGLGLFHTMELPPPGASTSKPHFVLIHGGGTATGALAIQMARLAGARPITTCSPRNFSRMKDLGAVETFDYHSPSCGSDIQNYTNNSLHYALDCITDTASMKSCYAAISSEGGQYVGLNPVPVRAHTRRNVKARWIIAFTLGGRPVNWQRPFKRDAKPKHRQFGEEWFEKVQELLDGGLIDPAAHQVQTGNVDSVIEGIDLVRKGLAGSKLVYEVGSWARTGISV